MQRTVQEALPNGAEWCDWLVPNLQNRNYQELSPRENYSHERTLFPGFAVLLLCSLALIFARRGDEERNYDRGAGYEFTPLLDSMVSLRRRWQSPPDMVSAMRRRCSG